MPRVPLRPIPQPQSAAASFPSSSSKAAAYFPNGVAAGSYCPISATFPQVKGLANGQENGSCENTRKRAAVTAAAEVGVGVWLDAR